MQEKEWRYLVDPLSLPLITSMFLSATTHLKKLGRPEIGCAKEEIV